MRTILALLAVFALSACDTTETPQVSFQLALGAQRAGHPAPASCKALIGGDWYTPAQVLRGCGDGHDTAAFSARVGDSILIRISIGTSNEIDRAAFALSANGNPGVYRDTTLRSRGDTSYTAGWHLGLVVRSEHLATLHFGNLDSMVMRPHGDTLRF